MILDSKHREIRTGTQTGLRFSRLPVPAQTGPINIYREASPPGRAPHETYSVAPE